MKAKTKKIKSKGSLVAVEIGVNWYKLAQVETGRKGARITKLHVESFSELGGSVSVQLSQALKTLKLGRLPVIGILPRNFVNLRVLELPSTDKDELENMIGLQIGRQTPHARDEILSDYKVLGPGKKGYTRVMLSIVQKSLVGQRFGLLDLAGLDLALMTLSSEGLLYAVNATKGISRDYRAVLDVDIGASEFTVIHNGVLQFSRSILIGAEHLSENTGQVAEHFASEVRRSTEIFQTESGQEISSLMMTGAGARLTELQSVMDHSLTVPVEVVDLTHPLPSVKDADDASVSKMSFSSMIGLAEDLNAFDFDLTPDSVMIKKDIERKARGLVWTGVLAMSVLFLISINVLINMYEKKNYLEKLDSRILATHEAESLERKEEKINLMKAKLSEAQLARVLLDIHKATPDSIHYNSISLTTDRRLLIKGSGSTLEGNNEYARILEQSDVLENVTFNKNEKSPNKALRSDFEIECTLKDS